MSIYDEISKGIKLPKNEIKKEKAVNYRKRLTKDEMHYLNNYDTMQSKKDKLIDMVLHDHLIYL